MSKDKVSTGRLKAIFNDECRHLKIDRDLVKKIEQYRVAFTTKKDTDHAEFFGGNLIGCYSVRFTENDRNKWFREILGVDEDHLLKRCKEVIDPAYYIVAGDVMNQSFVWLAHRMLIADSKSLTDADKKFGMVAVFQIMQYKFLTSRMYVHWPFPADKSLAQATINRLSGKYSIKSKGNWANAIHSRAEEIADTSPKNPHYKTIIEMEIDITPSGPSEGVAYLISDVQSRIRDMMKNIYNEFLKARDAGARVNDTTAKVDLDGEAALRHKLTNTSIYKRYIVEQIGDKFSFIKPELVEIITRAMRTMDGDAFQTTLYYISENYHDKGKFLINDGVDKDLKRDIVEVLMDNVTAYLSNHRDIMRNEQDIPALIGHLKGVYTASKASNPDILNMRAKFEEISKLATGIKTPAKLSAIRTGLMLYIILRAYTMKAYTT